MENSSYVDENNQEARNSNEQNTLNFILTPIQGASQTSMVHGNDQVQQAREESHTDQVSTKWSVFQEIVGEIGHILDAEEQSLSQDEEESAEVERDWKDYSKAEKRKFILLSLLKLFAVIALLYLFLLSLNFMSIGFTLVTSYALKAGGVIRFLLKNPFSALAIGIISTAIVQNSTAITSIAVIMVGAGIIPDVKSSVPIIMGANFGECVTNSFMALTLVDDPHEFKKAFSAAVLNDAFNFLSNVVFFPLEIVFKPLFRISEALTKLIPSEKAADIAKINFLNYLIDPLLSVFIVLNSTAVDLVSSGDSSIKQIALRCCDQIQVYLNKTEDNYSNESTWYSSSTMPTISTSEQPLFNQTNETNHSIVEYICRKQCSYWRMPMLRAFGDGGTGLFWIIFSLVVLLASLFGIVKVLSLLIVGPIAKLIRKALNKNLPGKFKWLMQVILFFVAFGLTLILQAQNLLIATLVPLCGVGIISLQRVYVMTLGSNIGNTVTGFLTAFAQPPSTLIRSLQLAFVNFFLNCFGVLLWLPLPFMRFPKRIARRLSNIVFKYRWFLYVYVGVVYFIIPFIIFGLSLIPKWIGLAVVGIPVLVLVASFLLTKCLQNKFVHKLPESLKTLEFLPKWLRSLEPYDNFIKRFRKKSTTSEASVNINMENRTSTKSPSPNNVRGISPVVTIRDARRPSLKFLIGPDELSSDEEDKVEESKPDSNRSSRSVGSKSSNLDKSVQSSNQNN